MPGINRPMNDEVIIADLMRAQRRRLRAGIIQTLQPAKDRFTVAASPASTYTLSSIPYQSPLGSSLNVSLNGDELVEGVDYTADFTTAILTVTATLKGTPTPADVITVDYWTTGDLIAASTVADLGLALWAGSGGNSSDLQRYDFVNNSWDAVGSHPNMANGFGCAMATISGLIYAAGGSTSSPIATVQSFDPNTNAAWVSHTSMSTTRARAGFGVVGGKLYVFGGQSGVSFTPVTTGEVYDPLADSWSSIASMSSVCWAPACGVYNSKIYASGGGDVSGNTPLSTTRVYDPGTNSWTATLAPMPTPVRTPASAVLNGKLHVVGGWAPFNVTTLHQVYDIVSDTWSTAAALPGTGNDGAAAVAYGGKLYYVCGASNDGTGSAVATAYSYDPNTDVWTTLPSAPVAQFALQAVTA